MPVLILILMASCFGIFNWNFLKWNQRDTRKSRRNLFLGRTGLGTGWFYKAHNPKPTYLSMTKGLTFFILKTTEKVGFWQLGCWPMLMYTENCMRAPEKHITTRTVHAFSQIIYWSHVHTFRCSLNGLYFAFDMRWVCLICAYNVHSCCVIIKLCRTRNKSLQAGIANDFSCCM